MEFGVVFPTSEIGNDPVVIRDFAQAAEELGYSHIQAFDHVVGAVHEGREPALWGPYTEEDPFHEPIALFGYLAAVTKRIHFSTGVMILPQRQTVLVAKQVAALAVLSGGRMRLGVGTGWNYVEYEALGVDFKKRGALLDEQIDVLRRLWSEPIVDFTGRFHRIDRAGLNPLPLPPRPIPIWMGGFNRVAFERAARIGDGFIFGSQSDPQVHAQLLLDLLHANGRDPKTFGIDHVLTFHAGPKVWHEAAAAWARVGAQFLSVRTMGPAGLRQPGPRFSTPQQHIDALKTFMAEMKGYRSHA